MLRLVKLCKGYQDGGEHHSVLQGAELDLKQGEQLALMGESGSGKSTLLNLIAGLDSADSGEIWMDKVPIHSISDYCRQYSFLSPT
jgi:putative ABC transport system ATP-binding protein